MRWLLSIAAVGLLGGCSAVLDFDRQATAPGGDVATVDAATIDAATVDADTNRDALAPIDSDTADAGSANDAGAQDAATTDGGEQCDAGFEWNGTECADIDECSTLNGQCVQICRNTSGGFECACESGFDAIAGDCVDIDECESGTDNCAVGERCANLSGSFTCVSQPPVTVLAEEPFDYAAGSVESANGGSGWTGPWAAAWSPSVFLQVTSPGLTYAGLAVAGNKASYSGGTIGSAGRTLPRQQSGVVYLQAVLGFGSRGHGGTPTIRFEDGSDNIVGGIGNNSQRTTLAILDPLLNELADSERALNTPGLTVVRIDYETERTSMFVTPDLATFDYADPGMPTAIAEGFAPEFDRITVYFRSGSHIDEIQLLTQPPPAPVMIAEESFDYPADTALSWVSGGSGWSGPWRSTHEAGAPIRTQALGLTYDGLTTAGGSATWQSGGNGIAQAERRLARQHAGVTWVRFVSDFPATGGGNGTPRVQFLDGERPTGSVGDVMGTNFGILDGSRVATPASSSEAPIGDLSFIYLRIDYTRNVTSLFVNPDLAGFDLVSPPAPDAEYDGLAPAFDTVQLYLGEGGTIDELAIMNLPPR